jgi:hypothetical protein
MVSLLVDVIIHDNKTGEDVFILAQRDFYSKGKAI